MQSASFSELDIDVTQSSSDTQSPSSQDVTRVISSDQPIRRPLRKRCPEQSIIPPVFTYENFKNGDLCIVVSNVTGKARKAKIVAVDKQNNSCRIHYLNTNEYDTLQCNLLVPIDLNNKGLSGIMKPWKTVPLNAIKEDVRKEQNIDDRDFKKRTAAHNGASSVARLRSVDIEVATDYPLIDQSLYNAMISWYICGYRTSDYFQSRKST